MARERVITRTVTSTKIEVLCMNVTNASVEVKEFDITPSTENQVVALKVAQKLYDTDTFKLVSINKMTQCEQIYGMTEIDFMKYARPMDSERHFIGTDEIIEEVTEEVTEEVKPGKKRK